MTTAEELVNGAPYSPGAGGVRRLGVFIDGKWRPSATDRYSPVYNANTGDVIVEAPRCLPQEVSEAVGDVQRGAEIVEFACGAPTLLMGESLENVSRGLDVATCRHRRRAGQERDGARLCSTVTGAPSR